MKEIVSAYGFTMYPNYLEAIDTFTQGDDKKFGRLMRILTYYGIYGEEIAETPEELLFFNTVKSSVETSTKRRAAGAKGGSPALKITESHFKKPTVEEVQNYCKERKNGVDAEKFWNYYEAKGWKVGKSGMKDWKASVRTWEKNNFGNSAKVGDVLHDTANVESF